jgi:hypothetical protein
MSSQHESHTDPIQETSIIVEIALIDPPMVAFSKVNQKKVDEIAASFEVDGQLQPVAVRPHPKEKGRLELIFGRHRLAAAKQNRQTMIEVKVFDFDDEEVESAVIAENVFRNQQANAATRGVYIGRWSDIYKAKYPETTHGRPGKADRSAAVDDDADKKTDDDIDGDHSVPVGTLSKDGSPEAAQSQGPKKAPKAFHKMAAEASGLSPSTVRKYEWLAKKLGQENLELLQSLDISKHDLQAAAAIEDETLRLRAVTLMASGMPPKEAIAFATAPENATFSEVGEDGKKVKAEADMTDEEWLEFYCGDLLHRLTYQIAYKRDALLYRHTNAARGKFRAVAKPKLAQSKTQVRGGRFSLLLSQICNVAHPKHWLICGKCGGKGIIGVEGQCQTCYGAGFLTKTEGGK